MKCVCIVHNYTKDSFAGMSVELAYYLAKIGINVLFISHRPYFEQPIFINDYSGFIHVYSWPTNRRPTGLKSLIWFVKIFKRYNPDKLIGHFVGSNISIIVSKLLSFRKTKTLVYYHTLSGANKLDAGGDNIGRKLKRIRKKWFYNLFCDIIICPTKLAKDDFIKVFGNKSNGEKCKIILSPLIDRYKRDKLNLTRDNIIISYLGRLDPTKGISELLRAFIRYMSTRETRIILHIAGTGSLEKEIISMVLEHPQIVFEGYKKYEEVDDYISMSDFMIVPSIFDTTPTVGIESLMNGVPVLLSVNTGLASYINDFHEGLLFKPTISGLIEVFGKVEMIFDDIDNMRINARNSYIEKFTIKTYCLNMLAILQN